MKIAGLFVLIGIISAAAPLRGQSFHDTIPRISANSQLTPITVDRKKLYLAGAGGQLLGIGAGWLIGQYIGFECPNDPDVMCEAFVPDDEMASRFGMIAGGFIVPPIVVRLSNPGDGQILKDYLFSGVALGLTALIAEKHPKLYYALPVIQLITVVESEIASAKR